MRSALALLPLSLVLAGCGRTYTTAEVRRALAAEGISARGLPAPNALLHVFYARPHAEGFPPLSLAVDELLVDTLQAPTPAATSDVPGGEVEIFGDPHEAWEAEQAVALFRRGLLRAENRRAARELGIREVRYLSLLHVVRRGNVLFVEVGPQPRLRAAAARLP